MSPEFEQMYDNRSEIRRKLYDKLLEFNKHKGEFIAKSTEFKNNELLNLFWHNHDTFSDAKSLRVVCDGLSVYVYRCRSVMELTHSEELRYWRAYSARDTTTTAELERHRIDKFEESPAWSINIHTWNSEQGLQYGFVTHNSDFGPGHKGDSIIDYMTWLLTNKDFIFKRITANNNTNKLLGNAKLAEANIVKNHTMNLLKDIIEL